ncbi:MAG: methyltransferase domain-containing protein [Candidatus Eisenbacteria bacterium]
MKPDLDPYSEFAAVYDRWQWLHTAPFSTAMIVRMEQALSEWGVPERSLLDLACGTGTLARWWSEEHPDWSVLGVDRSPAMVERARSGAGHRPRAGVGRPGHERPSGAPSSGTRSGSLRSGARSGGPRSGTRSQSIDRSSSTPSAPDFEVQDIGRLSLDRRFGMATCFFDSLNHITRRQELSRLLASARKALHPKGLFLFDLIDEDSFEEIFSSPWVVQDDDLYVGSETQHFFRGGAEYGRVRYTFFDRSPAAGPTGSGSPSRSSGSPGPAAPEHAPRWHRYDAEILERCWRREEFDPMVADAGLEIIHVQLIDPEEQEEVFVPRRLYVCSPE